MRTWLGIAFLLLMATVAASTDAAPPKNPPPQASLDADKLAPGVFAGTVVSIPNGERVFTVNVAYQKLQLKPGQNLNRANQTLRRDYNRIIQLQNQMMRPPSRHHNPMHTMQQLQNAVNQFQIQLARTEANLFQVINATQKVDFQVEENVKVRIRDLPEQFDEKGNIKRYSREELAELKGKEKTLPGYESSLDSLKTGQIVQVTLGVHKKPRALSTSSSSPSAADKDKDGDKEKAKETEKEKPKEAKSALDEDAAVQHKLQVRMIVILKDSDSPQNSTNPAKKNK